MIPSIPIELSGERFRVTYRLAGDETTACQQAQDIRYEQTVEFPADLVPAGDINDHIVGALESFERVDYNHFQAVVSYAIETSGFDITQLLNVVFGNFSIKPGVRVEHLELPTALLAAFKGPRFGREGWRRRLGIPNRPLLSTALKPMGLPAREIGELAYRMALGGIDIIKDDHGLANQPFAPYKERVERSVEAVARANLRTGLHCVYVPNVTAAGDATLRNALFAKTAGAGGLLISPGLTGFGVLQQLAEDGRINLPIMSHPAFLGSFVTSPDNGISHQVLFGQIARLAGADASVYPNYGGRFSFSREECISIVSGTSVPMGHIKPIFPAPGGGMTISRVPEMLEVYGRDVIFLVGGGLHKQGPDLVENGRYFHRLVEAM
jgi:ribulose-bisphosphate carboxylase large chain